MSDKPITYEVACANGHAYRVTVPPQYPDLQKQRWPGTCVKCNGAIVHVRVAGPLVEEAEPKVPLVVEEL